MNDNLLHIRNEGTGRPLVLIHGWSCPGRFFQPQIQVLRDHARCIVPDLPGHGRTAGRLPLSIASAADAVYSTLADRELEDIVLVGWSMGALVSYALIERYGADRISSFVAVDMSPKVLNAPDWSNGTLNGLNAELNKHFLDGMVADWPKLPGRIARRLFAADCEPAADLVAFARQEIAAGDPEMLRPMWASLTAQDFRPLLQDFPVPFHLAAGLKSQLYGAGVHAWHADNVPDYHFHGFEDSGHVPHMEEPEKFNDLLLGLVRE
ncbi:alpha/beta fold hydrolase [Roseibium sp. Sym1]|uniref:alpha/beta fold hydrolase n=1 Tax=Roseibium sp. Sym1 TaxID=3016006 RepID=UPI0022B453A8|nr:alpha/beta fold hydrolase [Roseibium sp. Sym1]